MGAVLHRRDVSRGGDGRTLLWEFNRSDAIDTGCFQREGYVSEDGEFPFRAFMDAARPIFWFEIEAPQEAYKLSFWPDAMGALISKKRQPLIRSIHPPV